MWHSVNRAAAWELLGTVSIRVAVVSLGPQRNEVARAIAGPMLRRGCAADVYWLSMKIVLVSTYELGRQPFGLASPAAWLRKRGHAVACFDLTRQELDAGAIRAAELIAVYLPMHTATRLACKLIPTLRERNPATHICSYGLYAPINAEYLRSLGVETILGGEFEKGLAHLAERLSLSNGEVAGAQQEPVVSLE